MDWASVIERQHAALMRVVAFLFTIAGNASGAMLPRSVYRAVLMVLRPAESALRRLIVIAAQRIVLKARASRGFPAELAALLEKLPAAERLPTFGLIDPLKRFGLQGAARFQLNSQVLPRISVPGWSEPYFLPEVIAPNADDSINAQQLLRRLHALKMALETLPKQARRLARWRTKGMHARQAGGLAKPSRLSPFRPGFPPGYRRSRRQAIDEVLADCHYFAVEAWKSRMVCLRKAKSFEN